MLIYPIFISDDPNAEEIISTLPEQKRWGIHKLQGFLGPLVEKGLKGVILFGVPMQMEKVRKLGFLQPRGSKVCAYNVNRILEEAQRMILRPRSSSHSSSSPRCFPLSCSVSTSVSANTHLTVTVVSYPLTPTPYTPTCLPSIQKPRPNVSQKLRSLMPKLARIASRRAI